MALDTNHNTHTYVDWQTSCSYFCMNYLCKFDHIFYFHDEIGKQTNKKEGKENKAKLHHPFKYTGFGNTAA